MANIKEVITDLISYDVQKDYYKNDEKNKVVDNFKKILFEDDVRVRKFLEKWFKETAKMAKEFNLVDTGKEEVGGKDTEPTGEEDTKKEFADPEVRATNPVQEPSGQDIAVRPMTGMESTMTHQANKYLM